ncbi:MAG: hypothetical protein JOZ72_07940 [Alphaproteobacteria bacterium]|nr:hypothetical protein [Alphaproteobacteria bacterium]
MRLDRIRPYQRGGALYCLIAAVAIGASARAGLLPGHDLAQIAPLSGHLVVNGLSLWFAAGAVTGPGQRSAMMRVGVFLSSYALGIVGLILAVSAVFDLTMLDAPALLLVVPGLAGLLPILAGGEERHVGAEALDELPRIPFGPLLAGFAGSVVRQTIVWIVLFAAFFLLVEWYFVLKHVLWQGARYDLFSVARNNIAAALDAWPVVVPLFFIGIVTASSGWGPLLRPAVEGFKERLGFASLTPHQRAIVQARLYRLWSYANAPEQEGGSIAALFLPLVPAFAFVGLALWFLWESQAVAEWLFPATGPRSPGAWSLLVRNHKALIWPTMLIVPAAWSLYRLGTDLWPQALKQALVVDLQKGPGFDMGQIRALRRAIARDTRQSRDESAFAPPGYLLEQRLRRSRWLYAASIVALLVAVLVTWRSLAGYTLITDAGFEDVGFLTGRHFYRYDEVVSVQPTCFLLRNDDVGYQVEFRDGRSADLLEESDLPGALAPLVRIDERLRHSRAAFRPLADNPLGLESARDCARTLGAKYGDGPGFARIMHAPAK